MSVFTNRATPARTHLRLTAVVLALGAAVLGAQATTASASAARDGSCDSGEFCYYFNSDEQGSISDFTTSVDNYGTDPATCYVFRTKGKNGYNDCIKNAAASAWNRSSKTVTVYYNSYYDGSVDSQTFAPGAKGQLTGKLYNGDASHRFGSSDGGGGTVTGSQAMSRAKVWVDNGVPYNQSAHYQGYREDCSGYVSMAWGLPTPGLVTNTMGSVGSYISKSSLKQGDALLNSASGNSGHVTLFDRWANSDHTSYWGYEESGSHGAIHRVITYPYFPGYGTFKPFRYRGLK